jgi:CMP-N,N'-diacetyllegionaminic acid synthase
METLAIIPCRKGSKGLPGKNTKDFCGKPLVLWTIEEIKKCKSVTRVLLSTDDPKAREVALANGVEVPFMRPADISGDLATDYEFISHALNFLQSKESYSPDIVIRLPVTSPLRRADHVEHGIQTLVNTPGADSVRPICPVSKHPYKFWKKSSDTRFIEPFLDEAFTGFKEPANLPRQLFPEIYQHTGAADFIWTKTILDMCSVSGRSVGYFFMEEESSVNIDTEEDFMYAEYLMKFRLSKTE